MWSKGRTVQETNDISELSMTFSFLMEFTTEVDANKLQLSLAWPARNRVSQALLLVQKENITFLAKSVFRFQPK